MFLVSKAARLLPALVLAAGAVAVAAPPAIAGGPIYGCNSGAACGYPGTQFTGTPYQTQNYDEDLSQRKYPNGASANDSFQSIINNGNSCKLMVWVNARYFDEHTLYQLGASQSNLANQAYDNNGNLRMNRNISSWKFCA